MALEDAERRKPTEMAQMFFSYAANTAFPGIQRNGIAPNDLANVLHKIAAGLEEMAIGLRATYISLQEVKQLLRSGSPPGAPGVKLSAPGDATGISLGTR